MSASISNPRSIEKAKSGSKPDDGLPEDVSPVDPKLSKAGGGGGLAGSKWASTTPEASKASETETSEKTKTEKKCKSGKPTLNKIEEYEILQAETALFSPSKVGASGDVRGADSELLADDDDDVSIDLDPAEPVHEEVSSDDESDKEEEEGEGEKHGGDAALGQHKEDDDEPEPGTPAPAPAKPPHTTSPITTNTTKPACPSPPPASPPPAASNPNPLSRLLDHLKVLYKTTAQEDLLGAFLVGLVLGATLYLLIVAYRYVTRAPCDYDLLLVPTTVRSSTSLYFEGLVAFLSPRSATNGTVGGGGSCAAV